MNRDSEFSALLEKAHEAGRAKAAIMAAAPGGVQYVRAGTAMNFSEPFPICGFAWVNIRPGNSPFANWLKKNDLAHKDYYGGVNIWIGDYDQSMDLKYAHAMGMVEIFKEAGILAYAGSRLD